MTVRAAYLMPKEEKSCAFMIRHSAIVYIENSKRPNTKP